MVSFPNAKLNIGLQVLGKRDDGYHNLQTIFYPAGIKDALEIISNETSEAKEIVFSNSGRIIDGSPEDNLCLRAYHLIKKDFPQLPNIKMHLHKNIPMGAGMGGGSADAAFVLTLLNNKYKLEIPEEKLLVYALQLGSDCPFFIINKPCIAEGRGELLNQIELDLSAYKIIIVNSGIHVNTASAFKELKPTNEHNNLATSILQPIDKWRNLIKNDFEEPVFAKHPVLKEIKASLYESGALFALMSGSGSTIYGIFDKNTSPSFKFPDTYFLKWV